MFYEVLYVEVICTACIRSEKMIAIINHVSVYMHFLCIKLRGHVWDNLGYFLTRNDGKQFGFRLINVIKVCEIFYITGPQ